MRVVRVFFDVSMSNGHLGLSKIARDHKIQIEKLPQHEFVVFVNRPKTSIKMYAPGNVIAHYRGSRRIDMRTIQHLPNVFAGGNLNYDKAIAKVLEKELPIRELR